MAESLTVSQIKDRLGKPERLRVEAFDILRSLVA